MIHVFARTELHVAVVDVVNATIGGVTSPLARATQVERQGDANRLVVHSQRG